METDVRGRATGKNEGEEKNEASLRSRVGVRCFSSTVVELTTGGSSSSRRLRGRKVGDVGADTDSESVADEVGESEALSFTEDDEEDGERKNENEGRVKELEPG
jgi:hypothetical protein